MIPLYVRRLSRRPKMSYLFFKRIMRQSEKNEDEDR